MYPHLRLPNLEKPCMVIARSRDGVTFDIGDAFGGHHEEQAIHAVFFLVSPENDPSQHLRVLAQLAGHVDKDGFMAQWLTSTTSQEMKEILLREDRFMSLRLEIGMPTEPLIDLPISQLAFPEDCLVAIIHRRNQMVVPRGSTVLEKSDQLTIIGDKNGIQMLKAKFHTEFTDSD